MHCTVSIKTKTLWLVVYRVRAITKTSFKIVLQCSSYHTVTHCNSIVKIFSIHSFLLPFLIFTAYSFTWYNGASGCRGMTHSSQGPCAREAHSYHQQCCVETPHQSHRKPIAKIPQRTDSISAEMWKGLPLTSPYTFLEMFPILEPTCENTAAAQSPPMTTSSHTKNLFSRKHTCTWRCIHVLILASCSNHVCYMYTAMLIPGSHPPR